MYIRFKCTIDQFIKCFNFKISFKLFIFLELKKKSKMYNKIITIINKINIYTFRITFHNTKKDKTGSKMIERTKTTFDVWQLL